MLAYYGVVAIAAISILGIANSRPHASFSAREEDAASGPVEQLTAEQATANFPEADITEFRSITQDTLDLIANGDQSGANARFTDLETAWDDAEADLKPLDETAWTFLDSEIDDALTAVREPNPDSGAEQTALTALSDSLTP